MSFLSNVLHQIGALIGAEDAAVRRHKKDDSDTHYVALDMIERQCHGESISQEEVDAAFVEEYCNYIRAILKREPMYYSDLYCNMSQLNMEIQGESVKFWWLPTNHPVGLQMKDFAKLEREPHTLVGTVKQRFGIFDVYEDEVLQFFIGDIGELFMVHGRVLLK